MHGERNIPHRLWRLGRLASSVLIAAALSLVGVAVGSGQAALAQPAASTPRLSHVFLIMEENNGYHDVIGNPAAPNLNYLAKTFGVETDYFGVSQDSSETNYVGLLGGNVFNVTSDDAYWKNTVNAPSLISQLDKAGISWKAYLQALPHPGYEGICYPAKCNGAPDSDPLYVSKHDGIQNFTTSQNSADWSRQVPIGTLAADLRSGDVPAFSYVVPDECHDMHGDPPYCLDSGNIGDPENQRLVAVGDAYLGHLVSEITHASFWAKGNNAIAITYDNGDNTAGCCDANPGGGQIATIVITSHGPRGAEGQQPGQPLLDAEHHPAHLRPGLPAVHLRHQARQAADRDVRGHRLQGDRHQRAARAELAHPDPRRSAGADLLHQGHPDGQPAGPCRRPRCSARRTTASAPSRAPRPATSGRSATSCPTPPTATRTSP